MKKDKNKVAKLANQAATPGTANPGAARPVEVEVVPLLPAVPALAGVELLVGEDVIEGLPNPPSVRVPTVLKRSGLVVARAPPLASQNVSSCVITL